MSVSVDGIKLSAINCGIKQDKTDLVLIEACEGATMAGVFTQNAFCAAPVHIAKQHLADAACRYLLINSGNANCGTGEHGFVAANASCAAIANAAGVDAAQVLPFSTGVIGEPLPYEKIEAAASEALNKLSADSWSLAAEGIMTTDSYPKLESVSVDLSSGTVKIIGMSKGAGMIKPNMATMLGYVATDATISQTVLQQLINEATEKSFNRITVDGDTSTNDACMLIATGRSHEVLPSTEDYVIFKNALDALFLKLAQHIIRDGEGATKFVEVAVEGGNSSEECLKVAYAIAESPLVKTAIFAQDANWGRILAAAGRSGIESFDVSKVQIRLNDVLIVDQGGRAASYTEEAGTEAMRADEIKISISLNRGSVNESVYTTDFSYDYVKINAEYRS